MVCWIIMDMSFRSVVVMRAANVLVGRRWFRLFVGDLGERHAIEPVLEDRLDVAVRAGTGDEGAGAGGLEALGAVGFVEAQDAQAGAVPLLGVTTLAHDRLGEL